MADDKKTHAARLLQTATQRMPIPNPEDSEAWKIYSSYIDTTVEQGLAVIEFPVSAALYERHKHDTSHFMSEVKKPSFRKQLEDSIRPIHISEHGTTASMRYLDATGTLDVLLLERAGKPTDMQEFSPRYEAITTIEHAIYDCVWQGQNTEKLVKTLASLLYDPKDTLNATQSAESAALAAEALVTVAQQVKNQALGIGKGR